MFLIDEETTQQTLHVAMLVEIQLSNLRERHFQQQEKLKEIIIGVSANQLMSNFDRDLRL